METARRGRPRSEPFDVQRVRVVEAARELFTRRGYDGTTVAEIARTAGVPRAIVYETVGDKPAVLAVVADQVADELIAAFGEQFGTGIVDANSLGDFVLRSTEWFISAVRNDPSLAAMLRLSTLLPEAEGHGPHRARKGVEDLIAATIHRSNPTSVARDGPSARLLALMIVATTEAVAFRAIDEDLPGDLVASLLTEMTVGGLMKVTESRAGRGAIKSLDSAPQRA